MLKHVNMIQYMYVHFLIVLRYFVEHVVGHVGGSQLNLYSPITFRKTYKGQEIKYIILSKIYPSNPC
jgi:hypothetical protein